MNYRSSLSRARGWGSAGRGSHHWSMQRTSAIALLPLTLWLVFSLGSFESMDYTVFTQWISRPWVPALLSLFFACAYYHAALGIQVVVEDYVHGESIRVASLMIIRLVLLLMAVSTIVSVLITAL